MGRNKAVHKKRWGPTHLHALTIFFFVLCIYLIGPATRAQSSEITGTISLPAGLAPPSGVSVDIEVTNRCGEVAAIDSVTIPGGSSSVGYSLRVPDQYFLIDGYFVYREWVLRYSYSGSDFLNKGYYRSSKSGTETTWSRKSAKNLPSGQDHYNINLTLLPVNTISGFISLPPGHTAPAEGLEVEIVLLGSDGCVTTESVVIFEGETSADYTLTTPADESKSWKVKYHYIGSDYVTDGFYASAGTTWKRDEASFLAGGQDYDNINLSLFTGNSISGTISLPPGHIAPADGVSVEIESYGSRVSVVIPAGRSSAAYRMTVPDHTGLDYGVGYSYTGSDYVQRGYYTTSGTKLWDFSSLAGGRNHTGIDLTLLKGNTISGTVSLPPGQIAPAGGVTIMISLQSLSDTFSGLVAPVTVPEGHSSVDYSLEYLGTDDDTFFLSYDYCGDEYWMYGCIDGDGNSSGFSDPVDLFWFGLQDYTGVDLNLIGVNRLFPYAGHLHQVPQYGPPGTTFIQSGNGFSVDSTVTLHFRNPDGEELAPLQISTDGSGAFTTSYTVPADKLPGSYSWWVVDDTTGAKSEVLGYLVTESGGQEISITTGPISSPLPPLQRNLGFGELTSEGSFDPVKDTFVIVHGWNLEDTTSLPDWVREMGVAIKKNNASPARGSNVLYWNWQQEARKSYGPGVNGDESCRNVPFVPFDKTENSGRYLAAALGKTLPKNYDKNIHFIGHSLGTLVSTHAARFIKKYGLPLAKRITHLVFLDSPCDGMGDTRFRRFLRDNRKTIFLDNYISSLVGGHYRSADVNVRLVKGGSFGHSYAHDWYKSSVVNFSDDILGDHVCPAATMPWGFYWWKKSNQAGAHANYTQQRSQPAYSLIKVSDAERRIAGHVSGAAVAGLAGAVEMVDLMVEYAKATNKIINILSAVTYDTAADIVDYVTDDGAHALYNTLGYLTLSHSSLGALSMPVNIPTDANALTFGFEFLYGTSDSILEVFLNNELVYQTSGDLALGEGFQLVPWINVEPFAGQKVTVTLRFSNPRQGTTGKIRVDDMVVAMITNARPFPWNLFLPTLTTSCRKSRGTFSRF